MTTRNYLTVLIFVAFAAAAGLAFYAGNIYGRRNMMEEFSTVSGILGDRVILSHAEYALAAIRRGDQKRAEELLQINFVLAPVALATILESITSPDHFYLEECSKILAIDDRARSDHVLDGLVERDVASYEGHMHRIRGACNALKTKTTT
jgi:hypothetical protein